MTKAEAISILNVIVHMLEPKYDTDRIEDAVDMALKALEQEPCEDAVSRQAVDVLVDELARAISDERCYMSRGRSASTIMQDILDLPSVNPQKIGHCKDCKWWKESDGKFRRGIGAESQCHLNTDVVYEGLGYCYMFKPQESEE